MDELHIPVLLEETFELLAPALGGADSLIVDCTLGLGGHAEAFLERLPQTRLVGIDRDGQALEHSRQRLARFGERVRFLEGNFHELEALWNLHGFDAPRGILADLGVSSMQLDLAERGFSFRRGGPLDMRMGQRGLSARDVVNDYPEAELERIFRSYGGNNLCWFDMDQKCPERGEQKKENNTNQEKSTNVSNLCLFHRFLILQVENFELLCIQGRHVSDYSP